MCLDSATTAVQEDPEAELIKIAVVLTLMAIFRKAKKLGHKTRSY